MIIIMSEITSNKRIAKNTLLLYFRSIIILFVSLYTSRIILDVLGVENYGVYNLVGGFVSMFSMISGTLASASQRFITYALGERNEKKIRTVFSTSVSLHVIMAIISIVLLEVLGTYFIYNHLNIPDSRVDVSVWVLHASVLALFFNILSVPFNALIIAHEKMNVFAYISLLEAILKLTIVFLVSYATFDKLILYSFCITLISIVVISIYVLYCRNKFAEARALTIRINKPLFKEMFSFSGWNLLGNGSMVLRNQGVDMILNMFFGVTINAAKGISNQVQTAVTMFVANFVTALNPQLTKSIAAKDNERRDFLIYYGAQLSFYLYSLFVIPLLVVIPQVLSLWLVVVPEFTSDFVRWLLVYSLLDSLSRLLVNSILANGTIKNYQIIVGTIKLLAMPISFVLLAYVFKSPLIGVWVNILLELFCLIIRLGYMQKLFAFNVVKYTKYVIGKCTLIFLISLGVSRLLVHFIIDNIFVFVPVSVILSSLIIFYFGIDSTIRNYVVSKVKSKL